MTEKMEGYHVKCPKCGSHGDSLDETVAIGFRYEDDEDGPYCAKCLNNGNGKKVYMDEVRENE